MYRMVCIMKGEEEWQKYIIILKVKETSKHKLTNIKMLEAKV